MLLSLICTLLQLYVFAIIARVLLSWVRVPGDHPVGRMVILLSKVVDPPLRSIGRMVPSFPVGNVRLDLSPFVLLIGVTLVIRIICR